ncbi:NAD(P)H:quinone oxidoreductase, type IV [Halteromyces radiatus]|uniref:NAD(P)H:quinone oxidoreductase, type IV n=1 Tax=Halteromyces radiatus TaxID=101107 RepID=UPI00222072A9|nr:NAD(P)H:quinone oxidoreductase, type IV [Halteromyces radiatus]KAI8089436.1 NAD(P)H:quinone oxidoreductase, type IV [Halteromyces radiatus]
MTGPKGNVFIVLYTVYHHVYKLAVEVEKGLLASGVKTQMFQVQETLPSSILTKINAAPKLDLPVIQPEQLTEADGYLFGFPTRFGMVPSQVKGLLDGTGALWAKNKLHGKFAGTFFSTGSSHGGQEVTAMSMMPYFAHHGIRYVPFGYSSPHLGNSTEILGGSPWGAGTIAGSDGSRQPHPFELEMARMQGEEFGNLIQTQVAGKQALLDQSKL